MSRVFLESSELVSHHSDGQRYDFTIGMGNFFPRLWSLDKNLPMLFDRIVLHSPHGITECCERLAPHIDSSLLGWGEQPFMGSLTKRGFAICKRIKGKNDFRSEFATQWSPSKDGCGTVIEGRFRFFPGTLYFGVATQLFLAWSFFTRSVPLIFTWLFGYEGELPSNYLNRIMGPPLMSFLTLLLFAGGRYSARKQEPEILDFLSRTIGATQADGQ